MFGIRNKRVPHSTVRRTRPIGFRYLFAQGQVRHALIMSTIIIVVLLAALTVVFAFLSWRYWQQAGAIQKRYAGVANVQAELAAAKSKLEQAKHSLQQIEAEQKQRRINAAQESEQAQAKHAELTKELSLLEENLEDISFGLYKPHFNFQTSDEYKTALEALRDKERSLLRDNKAVICGVEWSVGNSKKEGQRMVKQYTKVMLRAFNGECDNSIHGSPEGRTNTETADDLFGGPNRQSQNRTW